MENKVYVGNLSFATTEDELKELFTQAGTVTSVALIKDRDTGQSKGFAFIEMANQADAENAIRMFNGKAFGSRELKVNMAQFSLPDLIQKVVRAVQPRAAARGNRIVMVSDPKIEAGEGGFGFPGLGAGLTNPPGAAGGARARAAVGPRCCPQGRRAPGARSSWAAAGAAAGAAPSAPGSSTPASTRTRGPHRV